MVQKMKDKSIIYFASPYSHRFWIIRWWRTRSIRRVIARVLKEQDEIIPFITKNYHTIHYFCQYCVEKELLPLKALEMCLVNYKKSIEDVSERRQEKESYAETTEN